VPLAFIRDRRRAWEAEMGKTWRRYDVAVGASHSREQNYVSHGATIHTRTDFLNRAATLALSVAGTEDDVTVLFASQTLQKKTREVLLGWTQKINPLTAGEIAFVYHRARGYLSEPYKLVFQNVEVAPGLFLGRTLAENRPAERDRYSVYARLNRAWRDGRGATEASYRATTDDYGVRSHTFALELYRSFFGGRLMLRPQARLYTQSAADFYYPTLIGTGVQPRVRPDGRAPYYSSDYRLSRLRTTTLGGKAVWQLWPERCSLDASYERYVMRGRDDRTATAVYPAADVFTVGLNVTW
jgi:hypothetical protein